MEAALAAGADANAADKLGFTALHLAIKNKNAPLAMRLMEVEGVSLDAKTTKGFTPMLLAAWKGDLDIVSKLISKGADTSVTDADGATALGHYIARTITVDDELAVLGHPRQGVHVALARLLARRHCDRAPSPADSDGSDDAGAKKGRDGGARPST